MYGYSLFFDPYSDPYTDSTEQYAKISTAQYLLIFLHYLALITTVKHPISALTSWRSLVQVQLIPPGKSP